MKNILFVLTDQMRYDAIHAHGNPIIKTPTLDKMVEEGISFERAYTPCPVCVPARYTMHTGEMPHQTGVYENYTLPSVTERKSFMQYLQENGYQTFGAGKMHFVFPEGVCEKWGFDDRKVCDEDHNMEKNDFYKDIAKEGYGYVTDYKGVRSEMYYIPQVSQLPERLQHSHWTVDKCIEFLEERDEEKPFFIMTSFEKPHPPFEPPVPWNKLYRGPDMAMPKNTNDNDDVITLWNKFQNRYKYKDQGTDRNLIRQMKAHYYGEVSFVDYNLGRLMKKLEEKDLLNDTLVIFTSDHGEMLGDYNCYGKRCFLDSAARIPLILYGAGCRSKKCDVPVSLLDIFPTILDYAGINAKKDVEGNNLLNIAEDGCEREYIFGEYEKGEYANYMIFGNGYKYIYSVPDEKEYLFDMSKDPDELMNRAQNPLYIKITEELRHKLVEYLEKNGLHVGQKDGTWKKYGKKTMEGSASRYLLFQDPSASIPKIADYTTSENQKTNYQFSWLTENFEG